MTDRQIDLFAVTTFDDTMLGIVERCEATNVTTFPDIIDDTGHAFSVYGTLAYALDAARDYITVGPDAADLLERDLWETPDV